jgi:SAM-dependent methyltransferase
MQSAAQFWDKASARYARAPVRDEAAYAATLERVLAHLRPSDGVLELGCGTGTTAVKLAPHVAAYEGRDVSAKMLAIAEERAAAAAAGNLTFAPGDAAAPIKGAPFDAVLAFNLLHLLPDLDGTLAHIREALPPGGRFISKTPCLAPRGLTLKWRALLMTAFPVMRWLGKAPSFVAFLSAADLERRVATAGFEVVERADLPAMPPSRLIVARRLDG